MFCFTVKSRRDPETYLISSFMGDKAFHCISKKHCRHFSLKMYFMKANKI